VRAWTAARTAAEVERACIEHDVPVATAYSAVEIAGDVHMAARHDLVTVDDVVLGPVRQQAPYPRIVGEPAAVPSGAPALGADNVDVWCGLVGVTPEELEELGRKGVV
jgi:crotonobetainyl-CoA:carnitine CoA-transferase CaiB-like acyl-CoA transferase